MAQLMKPASLQSLRTGAALLIAASLPLTYYTIVVPVHRARQTGVLEYHMYWIIVGPLFLYMGAAFLLADMRDGQIRQPDASGKLRFTRKGRIYIAGVWAVMILTMIAYEAYLRANGFSML
jgi:hypothetical protein